MSQQQSFYFNWDAADSPTPAPITAQCETLPISWSRQAATGPSPVAPYYIQIFSSYYTFPILLNAGYGSSTNVTIPFPYDTQYQICMFDSQGNTGGCQAIRTVYPTFFSGGMAPPCSNLTLTPPATLQVTSNFGQYSWIPSCSDLVIQPTSGSPPYVVTVAPALQPAYNISGIGVPGLQYKLPLQWGIPFFVSMADSTGLTWSYGPLHAGPGLQSCLAGSAIEVSLQITIASAAAALVLGVVSALAFCFCWRHRGTLPTPTTERVPKKGLLVGGAAHAYAGLVDIPEEPDTRRGLLTRRSNYSDHASSPYGELGLNNVGSPPLLVEESGEDLSQLSRRDMMPSTASLRSVFYAEPLQTAEPSYILGGGSRQSRSETQTPPQTRGEDLLSLPLTSSPSRLSSSSQQVYVVHHERGPASMSIYTEDGAEIAEGADIVELPPVYSRPPARPRLSHQPLGDDATPNLSVSTPNLSVSPIRESSSPASDLCTTPTGLIPPRGIGWTNDQLVLPPEKGFRQVDS